MNTRSVAWTALALLWSIATPTLAADVRGPGGALPTPASSNQCLISDTALSPPWKAGACGSVATDVIWDTAGDLALGTGANTAAKLAIGKRGQAFRVNATTAEWIYLRDLMSDSGARWGQCFSLTDAATTWTCAGMDAFALFDGVGIGSAANVTSFGGDVIAYSATTTSGNYGGFATATGVTRLTWSPRVRFVYTPDSTSNAGAWLGLSSATTLGALVSVASGAMAGNPSEKFVAVGWDSTVSTAFSCCAGDGTNATCSAIPTAGAASNQSFVIWLEETGGSSLTSITCCVRNLNTGAGPYCVDHSTNLPAHATSLLQMASVRLNSTATRKMQLQSVYLGQGLR